MIAINGQDPLKRKRGKDGHQLEHDHLFQALLAGQPCNEVGCSAESTMTAILGRMASYSGQRVTWDEGSNPCWTWPRRDLPGMPIHR